MHPAKEDISLAGVLGALSDPMRLKILKNLLYKRHGHLSCTEAAPCPEMAKSTLSHHFRILRDAGLIRTTKHGVENHPARLRRAPSRGPSGSRRLPTACPRAGPAMTQLQERATLATPPRRL